MSDQDEFEDQAAEVDPDPVEGLGDMPDVAADDEPTEVVK